MTTASFASYVQSRFPFSYRILTNDGCEMVVEQHTDWDIRKSYCIHSPIMRIKGNNEGHCMHQLVEGFQTQIIDPIEAQSWHHLTPEGWTVKQIEDLIRQIRISFDEVFEFQRECHLLGYIPIQLHYYFCYMRTNECYSQSYVELFKRADITLIPLRINEMFFVQACDLCLWIMQPITRRATYQAGGVITQTLCRYSFLQKPIWTEACGLHPWAFKVVNIADIPPIDPAWLHQYQEGKVNPQIGDILL